MGTYTIGSGGDYATITAADTALTLPEAGGTIYELTGTVTDDYKVTLANYANGLTIRATTFEEADGAKGGTLFAGNLWIEAGVSGWQVDNINIETVRLDNAVASIAFNNCDIGFGSAIDAINITNVSSLALFTNCIIRDGADDGVYANSAVAGVDFVRCSIVDCSRYGALRTQFNDCFIYGSGTQDFHSTTSGNYNASSDTTASIFTNNLQSQASTHFNDYAGKDFNLAIGSALRTAGTGGGVLGAIIQEPVQVTAPATVARSETSVTLTSAALFGATQGTGGVKLDTEAVTVTSWAASSIDVTIPTAIALQYSSIAYAFQVTHDDTSTFDSGTVELTPPAGRSFIDLVSPVYSDNAYMLFDYQGTPAPVSTDQMEYDTLTPESSIANTPLATSEWVLASAPSITQTSTVQILRAATGVRSADWTITWEVSSSTGSSSLSLGSGLGLGMGL